MCILTAAVKLTVAHIFNVGIIKCLTLAREWVSDMFKIFLHYDIVLYDYT